MREGRLASSPFCQLVSTSESARPRDPPLRRATASPPLTSALEHLTRPPQYGLLRGVRDPRRSPFKTIAVATLLGLALGQASPALADELVKFGTAGPRLAGASVIQGYLTRPRGTGPFPAVVLLHSCLGLPADKRSIGDIIAGWGYVALFVDDFSSRGLKETCSIDFKVALSDAYGALAFLLRLPYVVKTRIGVIGYSQGADTALEIASSRFASGFAGLAGAKFRAAAAFYPPCANQSDARLDLPTLILVGALDDVTPAADCRRLADTQGRGSDVKLVVYPGARHLFDDPAFAGGRRLDGMFLQYDRTAAGRSQSELRDFLASKLAQ